MLKIFLTAIGVALAFAVVVSLVRSIADTRSQSESSAGMEQETTVTLEDTSWLAIALDTTDVSANGITATFEAGSLSGSDGCNRYTTSYTVSGSSLTIKTPMAGTMMACPAATMITASIYQAALAQVTSYLIEDNALLLQNADGATVITFSEDVQTLLDTSWTVTGLNNGNGAVTSVLADSSITLNFTGETQVGGSAGCNTYSGQYTATDAEIAITSVASTMRACLEEGISEQETQYLAALQNATTYSIENDSLVMRDDEGAMQVTATRQK